MMKEATHAIQFVTRLMILVFIAFPSKSFATSLGAPPENESCPPYCPLASMNPGPPRPECMSCFSPELGDDHASPNSNGVSNQPITTETRSTVAPYSGPGSEGLNACQRLFSGGPISLPGTANGQYLWHELYKKYKELREILEINGKEYILGVYSGSAYARMCHVSLNLDWQDCCLFLVAPEFGP